MTRTSLGSKSGRFILHALVGLYVMTSTMVLDTGARAAAAITVVQMNQAHDIAVAINDEVQSAIENMSGVDRADPDTIQRVVEAIMERELAKADNPLVANAAMGLTAGFLGFTNDRDPNSIGVRGAIDYGIQAAVNAKQPQLIAAAIVYVSTSSTSQTERDQAVEKVLTDSNATYTVVLSGLGHARIDLAAQGISTTNLDNRMLFMLSQTQGNSGQSPPTGDIETANLLNPYGGQIGGQTDTTVVYVP